MQSTTLNYPFILEVNGVQYEGLLNGSVTNSFENLSSEFSCDVSMPQNKTFPIKRGDKCRILIWGTSVLDGYINKIDTSLSADSHTITISGRDKTGDIIDNTLPANLNFNTPISLSDLSKKILDFYGIQDIKVIVKASNVNVFSSSETVSVEAGESAFDFLEKYAKKRQVMLSTDGSGNIVYTRAETEVVTDFININDGVNQGNVLNVEMCVDDSQRFNKYVLLSQTNSSSGNDEDDTVQPPVEQETYTTATSIDDEIRSTRVHYFVSDTTLQDQQSRQDRVDWEKNIKKANGFSYSITVQGFKNGKGSIWRPNTLITVNDEINSIYANLLIISVQFNVSLDSGTTTRLNLTTPDAFKILAEPKTKADSKSKKIATDYQLDITKGISF